MILHSRRAAWAVPGAILLSLVIAGQALGHTWSARIQLTSSGSGFAFDLAGVNSTTAVAALVEWNGNGYDVEVMRTTTSGSSWGGPTVLSTDGYDAHVAAFDPFVDVVWTQNNRVRYARSVDGGLVYGPSMALSSGSGFPINLSVGRGSAGLVVVAWQNGTTNVIRARVSIDGGVTFAPATTFASNVQDMGTSVAAGDGVAYLAYKIHFAKLRVSRSTDGGVTWSPPAVVTDNGYGVYDQFDLTASGAHAYLAYTVKSPSHPAWGAVRYRRTLDSGATWSAQRNLAPGSWKTEFPEIALQGGVVRAAYARRASGFYGVYYQQSNDGLNWAAPELVDSSAHSPYVTQAGKIIVMFEVGTGDAFVRIGT